MKKSVNYILPVIISAILSVCILVCSGKIQCPAELAEATEITDYTIEDLKNLQDFLLCKETSDLSDKNYDLDNDGIWSVFNLCIMKQNFFKKS